MGDIPLSETTKPHLAFLYTVTTMKVEKIPTSLKALDQWVCWRYEEHPSRAKPMKAPYCPATGQRANINEPDTWGSFDEACQRYQEGDNYDGVGLVLTQEDSVVGIDVDDCINEKGSFTPVAHAIIRLMSSYTEISPSGRGIRIFASGDLGDFSGRRKGPVELYNANRYLTVTGDHVAGTPEDVMPRLPQLRQLYKQYLRKNKQKQSLEEREIPTLEQADEYVLERMFAGKLGSLYEEIYHGDVSGVYGNAGSREVDESRADTLLFNALAFYTYQNVEQMRRLLLASPRANQRMEKWNKRVKGETTYLEYQIMDSITHVRRR
jgi:putative DNA primase/helicase